MTLANKTIGNALSGVAGFAWPILLALVSMPYIVHKLGNEAYGVLALVTSVLGFFAFLDLGVTSASLKYIAESYARMDLAEINRIVGSSLVVYIFVGLAGGSLIALMSDALVFTILKIPPSQTATAIFAFRLAACGFFINMLLGVLVAIPRAIQRYDIITKMNIVISTLITVSTVIILYLGYGLLQVVVANFIFSILSVIIYVVITRRLIKGLSFRMNFCRSTFRKLLSFGFFSLVVALSSTILFQLDRLLIGAFVGSASVAFYVVPATVATRIHSVIANLMEIVFPLSSELNATGRIEKMKELYTKASKYSFMVAVSIVVPVMILSGQIMKYWMGIEYSEKSSVVLLVLSLSAFCSSLAVVPGNLINGIGQPRINALFATLSAVINILLCLLLIPRYGINGAAFANLGNIIIVALYLLTVDHKILKIGVVKMIAEIWVRPLLAAVAQAIMTALMTLYFVSGITSLILVAMASFPVYYAAAYLFDAINKEDIVAFKSFLLDRKMLGDR